MVARRVGNVDDNQSCLTCVKKYFTSVDENCDVDCGYSFFYRPAIGLVRCLFLFRYLFSKMFREAETVLASENGASCW